MAKYIKHNSNYIRTSRHQYLKGGSTIFERDWVTVGSQLNFGPGKIPYYNNGNFIFTTSPIPHYQKKYKNGVTVATWTYEDVEDAMPIVNEIRFDEHTEDIRTYAYYGSCMELVRSSIENIIKTFPGNITVYDDYIYVLKNTQSFVCRGDDTEEEYVPVKKIGSDEYYYALNNPFDINVYLKDVELTQYDNELHYLSYSFKDYKISRDGGANWEDIDKYEIVMRRMYELDAPVCYETTKTSKRSISFSKNEIDSLQPQEGDTEERFCIKSCSLSRGNYYLYIKDGNSSPIHRNYTNLCYNSSDSPGLTLTKAVKQIKCNKNKVVSLIHTDDTEEVLYTISGDKLSLIFYQEVKSRTEYKYFQMFDEDEYNDTYQSLGWKKTTCLMDYWMPDTIFLNRCDDVQDNVRYSEKDTGHSQNQPVYTVTINDNIIIEGYIYNKQVIPLVTNKNLIIQPKEEIIEDYFKSLENFEKLLLTRDTKPLYTNTFITPFEYNLDYVYYKRQYTWPSNGYCIDITSTRYIDFLNRLTNMAQLFDETWTDNLWRRMTHEAIKNYDWTYTREFEPGEEEENIEGGERMHKVINIIGRVFDDIKRTIDVIKRNNKASYDADRNLPNALISDKLDLQGWDIFSTIPSYEVTEEGETEGETITKIVSASDETMESEIFDIITNDTYREEKWYPTLNPYEMTFADVDIEFMRRLLLSSKKIFMTKGTRQSIDMIMGLFGYGNMDNQNPNYTITEEYLTVTPKEYDYKEEGEEESFGEKIVRLNMCKENDLLYDEDASGIPVGSFVVFDKNEETDVMESKTYLIPFFDQSKFYDGNFYFQSKGGWCYNKADENEEGINSFKWTETLSYLHVVSQVHDLLAVNPNGVSIGDIYYVVNINDYIDFSETGLFSNFFVLEDDFYTENFSSWTNLDLSGETYTTENGYTSEEITKYMEYVQKALYLDSIIPYNIGNNPHVGYGKYDKGEDYYEYMSTPFKYSIETNNFDTSDNRTEAETITFDLGSMIQSVDSRDKVQIYANDIIEKTIVSPTYGRGGLRYATYDLDSIREMMKTTYYLNSKVIYFKNEINNNEYRKYFKTVIMKYLMQIVPSTSIFILVNFEEKEGQ